jgi:hypothetical protein
VTCNDPVGPGREIDEAYPGSTSSPARTVDTGWLVHLAALESHHCGSIDGVSWIHGLGYQRHIAVWEDPLTIRMKMDRYAIQFS